MTLMKITNKAFVVICLLAVLSINMMACTQTDTPKYTSPR